MNLTDKVKIGGLYRHFKGNYYRVTDVVHDSENWDQLMVVYYDISDPFQHRATRKLGMFTEELEKVRDVSGHDYKGPRFCYIPDADEPADWRLVAMRLCDALMSVSVSDSPPKVVEFGITFEEWNGIERIFDSFYDPLMHDWKVLPPPDRQQPKSVRDQAMPRGGTVS
jgi:hypothetical protein